MNKTKKLFMVLALFGLIFTSSATTSVFAAKIISKEAAKSAAFKQAGVKSSQVTALEIEYDANDDEHGQVYDIEFKANGYKYSYEIDANDGIKVYDVEFRTGSTEYDYEINAKTGRIIEFSSEPIND